MLACHVEGGIRGTCKSIALAVYMSGQGKLFRGLALSGASTSVQEQMFSTVWHMASRYGLPPLLLYHSMKQL